MIYVVLGMHKSGTTLVSQILHHSGINMGEGLDTNLGYDQGNKYERQSARVLNLDILNAVGVKSLDLAAPAQLALTPAQSARMQTIIQECNQNYPDWGFKDPRTCLTYPLWTTHLPDHQLIVVYRSLDQLWRRYRYVENPRSRHRDFGVARKLVLRWTEYTDSLIRILQQTSLPYVVLDYHKLMSTRMEFDRLQDFVGHNLVDMRRTNLYRHRRGSGSLPLQLAQWWYQWRAAEQPATLANRLQQFRGV